MFSLVLKHPLQQINIGQFSRELILPTFAHWNDTSNVQGRKRKDLQYSTAMNAKVFSLKA